MENFDIAARQNIRHVRLEGKDIYLVGTAHVSKQSVEDVRGAIETLSLVFIMLIRYISSPNLLVAMDRWLMGGLDATGYRKIASILPLLLQGAGILLIQATSFNHLALGKEMAMGHGVNVANLQRTSFLAGSLLVAAIVSLTGPIGFVGLLTPHAVRRLSGYNHLIVLPASFLLGASFLVLCDTIARTVVSPTEMPVGIITTLIGGPFFIYLLLVKSGRPADQSRM